MADSSPKLANLWLGIALFLASTCHVANAVTLRAGIADSKIPSVGFGVSEVNSVYLFGGMQYYDASQIVRYWPNSDSVSVVQTIDILDGRAFQTSPDTILIFGIGRSTLEPTIYRFDIYTRIVTTIGKLPVPIQPHLISFSFYDELSQSVYLLGVYVPEEGTDSGIYRYDIINNTFELVGLYQFEYQHSTSVVWHQIEQVAYIFLQQGPQSVGDILRYDPRMNAVTKLPVRLPVTYNNPSGYPLSICATFVPNQGMIYVIVDHELFKVNTFLHEIEVVNVEGWSPKSVGGTCAYVQNTDRLYIFGGFDRENGMPSNQIMYIDLRL